MLKKMSKYLLLLLTTFIGTANATILTFDDITSIKAFTVPVPDGYGGLDWEMSIIHKDLHPNSGYNRGRVSGDYTAWYNAPGSVSISSGTFDFNGAYFTSAWDSNLDIILEGWSSSAMLFTDTINVNNSGPSWFGANYTEIDELKIISQGSFFVMDDFTYEISHVPVPAAVWLFGSGLIGLIGIRKKISKASVLSAA